VTPAGKVNSSSKEISDTDQNTETAKAPRGRKGNGAAPPIDESALEGGPEIKEKREPFPDLEAALGLGDDGVTVTELLISVAVWKPKPTEYFRVHPDPEMARPAYVFIDREEIGSETCFVMPEARPYIAEHLMRAASCWR
jgi:hypothetical protein